MSDPKHMLEQINAFVEKAQSHVAAGDEVELAGLDEKVRELCEVIASLPQNEAKQYRQALGNVSTELTSLRESLISQQTEVREQVDRLNLQQKAAKAYQTSSGSVGTPKPSAKPKKD